MQVIDWTDEFCPVTEHFTVRDCLWLGQDKRLASAGDGLTDEIIARLVETCHMAENIREIVGCALKVTSMYRPPAYSKRVGGHEHDVHTKGIAIDFQPVGLGIDVAKERIRPHLDALDIRMERGTTNWIHIDDHPPGPSGREFVP